MLGTLKAGTDFRDRQHCEMLRAADERTKMDEARRLLALPFPLA
jgi:hypothetical protein